MLPRYYLCSYCGSSCQISLLGRAIGSEHFPNAPSNHTKSFNLLLFAILPKTVLPFSPHSLPCAPRLVCYSPFLQTVLVIILSLVINFLSIFLLLPVILHLLNLFKVIDYVNTLDYIYSLISSPSPPLTSLSSFLRPFPLNMHIPSLNYPQQ